MRVLLALLGLLACVGVAHAQPDSRHETGSLRLQDEGSTLGAVRVINCVGSGVTCTRSGATGTMTISGGSGTFSVTQVEIDFDTCGLGTHVAKVACEATVTDASITASSKILVSQAGDAPTGKESDDNEMDPLSCSAQPASGSFTLRCIPLRGPTHGKFKINYAAG